MKRIICLMLSACLLVCLLAGCGGEGGGKAAVPMGRYVERTLETLEGVSRIYGFQTDADGGIVFYGRSNGADGAVYARYSMPAGGGALVKTEQDWLSGLMGGGSLREISEGADGTVYLLYNAADGGMGQRVARRLPGGEPEDIPVADLAPAEDASGGSAAPGASVSLGGSMSIEGATVGVEGARPDVTVDGESTPPDEPEGGEGAADAVSDSNTYFFDGGQKFASGIIALDDGFLIYYGGDGVCRYQSDGMKRAEYPGGAFQGSTAVHGGTLLTQSVDGGELWSYDLESGRQNGSYTYDNLSFNTSVGMDGGGLFLADNSGIYRQAPGGAIWERLVDGGLTSLVMPNVGVSGLAGDGGDGFYALLNMQEDVFQLMHYVFDPDMPTDPDTELSIFSLKDNATIRQTIGEFQRMNPNVRVNFRVAMENGDDGSATAEDVIRALNTEILNGKGPDLLLLDGLNVGNYIEKGVLLDLTDLVNAQVAGQDLLPNLMSAYSKDGRIYGVPSKFTVPVMMGSAGEVDAVRSLSDLAQRAEAGADEQPPFFRAPDSLWDEENAGILMQYYGALSGGFLKDGAVDQQALADYFAAMLRIDAAVKKYTPQMGAAMIAIDVTVSTGGGFELVDMGSYDLRNGAARFHITELAGFLGLRTTCDNLSVMDGQKLDSLFGDKRFTPVGGIGVLASGKQQELAKSFVELLLSPTVQDSYVFDGYPVNGASLDKLTKELLEGRDDMGFAALCRTLNTPILVDEVLRDAVSSQGKDLLAGTVTPEQAAANVAEKTALYLAE